MFYYLIDGSKYANWMMLSGMAFTLIVSFAAILIGKGKLPTDQGRAFAVNGQKSKGKPRGAGIIFIPAFAIGALLFVPFKLEYAIYLVLVTVAMLTGYFDDASEKPWGELKKGILDFVITIALAVTYLYFNDNTIFIPFTKQQITIPIIIYGILIVILAWASINVTNCADGVDGLCGCLSCVTLASVYMIAEKYASDTDFGKMSLLLIAAIVGYLWFNVSPSILLMGDAGSRAIGLFIAIAMIKSQNPILYIPIAIILILDGGLGLIKLTIMRVFKTKKFMANLRTPIHDHMRKNKGWSDTQVVLRFVFIQIVVSALIIMTI